VSDTFSVTTILVLNADFVEKAEAITFEGINLYEGHVDAEDPNNINLDIANLQSGDLITIDIEFDVESGVDEYAFAYQLVPKSLVDQLDEGSTMGEVVKQNYVATEGETSILFGSVLITEIISGQTNHAILQTKIPALAQDIDYQVIVSADVGFLTIEQEPQIEELALSPILIDDRILSIAMLENVLVKVFTPPELLDKNEFTHLENISPIIASDVGLITKGSSNGPAGTNLPSASASSRWWVTTAHSLAKPSTWLASLLK